MFLFRYNTTIVNEALAILLEPEEDFLDQYFSFR